MHSYADRHTPRLFLRAGLSAGRTSGRAFSRVLRPEPLAKEVLQKALRIEPDAFDKVLEKLWIHGGAVVDYAENVSRGVPDWRDSYIAQSAQKQEQLDLMLRYTESSECRMASVVRHFGDMADSRKPCGICDFCAPDDCVGQQHTARPRGQSRKAAIEIVEALRAGGGVRATGKLHSELFPNGGLSRDEFEEVLGAMARAGLIRLQNAVFEKDGKQIPFRKAD